MHILADARVIDSAGAFGVVLAVSGDAATVGFRVGADPFRVTAEARRTDSLRVLDGRITCHMAGAAGKFRHDATLAVLSLPFDDIDGLRDHGPAALRVAGRVCRGAGLNDMAYHAEIAESVCGFFGVEPEYGDGTAGVPKGAVTPFLIEARRADILESAPRLRPTGKWRDGAHVAPLLVGSELICSVRSHGQEEVWRLTQGGQCLLSIGARHYVWAWEDAKADLQGVLSGETLAAVFSQPPFGEGLAAARRREIDEDQSAAV